MGRSVEDAQESTRASLLAPRRRSRFKTTTDPSSWSDLCNNLGVYSSKVCHMALTVTNALSISASPVPTGDTLSSPPTGTMRQNFTSMINQLLGVQSGAHGTSILSQAMSQTAEPAHVLGTVALSPVNSGAAELPLPGEAGGNVLPISVPTSPLTLSEVHTESIGVASADVLSDAAAMLPVMADGLPAEQSSNPSLPLTVGLGRMWNRLDENANVESASRLPETTRLNGGDSLPGTTLSIPMIQLMADGSGGDASINPISAMVSMKAAITGPSTPIMESTVATLDALVSQQQVRSLTPAAELLTPQPGNSLNAAALSPSGSSTAPTALIDTLPVPPRHAQFDSELGHRLVWMTKNNVSFAEIRMNPPQLGPIEIRVSVSHDQASVWMNAHHGVTRDALEQAIPRLREMLQDAGLTLSDTNISSNSNSSQQQGKGYSPFGQHLIEGDDDTQTLTENEDTQGPASGLRSVAVIDYFA